MKYKIFVKKLALLIIFIYSSNSNADITLVKTVAAPIPEDSILTIVYSMPLNTRFAGEFTLDKNSILSSIQTSIIGSGSVSLSIYNQDQITKLPNDSLFDVIIDIDNTSSNYPVSIEDAGIELNKGKYWFVIEATHINDRLNLLHQDMITPLDSYVSNSNYSNYWGGISLTFPLTITGHPVGALSNSNCSHQNINGTSNSNGVICN